MKDRIEPRHKVLIRGKLHGSGFARDVCVLDASSRGLLLTLATPPARGEMIDIMVNGHTLFGQVEWSSGRRMGMRFQERIDVLALIAGETGPLALKRQSVRSMKHSPAFALDWNQLLARKMQFVVFIGLMAIGALFLVDMITGTLGSLDKISRFIGQ